MHPEIEDALQSSLAGVACSLTGVGRVEVEPDYEATFTIDSIAEVKSQLESLLQTTIVDPEILDQHTGQQLDLNAFPLLARLIRRVTLHGGAVEAPMVEVTPPGNWI